MDAKKNLLVIGYEDELKTYQIRETDLKEKFAKKAKEMNKEMMKIKNPLEGYPIDLKWTKTAKFNKQW